MGRLVLTHSTYIEGLINVLKKLAKDQAIESITPGVITSTKGRARSLDIRITSTTISGYKLLARKGRSVQEVFIISKASEEYIIQKIKKLL